MSSFDAQFRGLRERPLRTALVVGALLALGAISACTVRPLYADSTTTSGLPVRGELSQIAVKPVSTRYGQEVRNHLIFLFGGGKGQPAASKYSLQLSVVARAQSAVLIQSAGDNEPTAGTLTMIGSYTLTENGKGATLAAGERRVTSNYDLPKQEYAALRAVRDAENRAARELAQVLQLAIAQEMSQR
ncbi:MAG TPA: LPS assembly lipoprotein LptE [Mesorhizobium sp.]|jgi:LPS-assembly lipoprotein